MILITGGLGYLGGRISEYLLALGEEVRIATSRDSDVISLPVGLERCEIVQISFADKQSLENACKGITYIIHLAALNAKTCGDDPEKALFVNVLGTLRLLNAAKKMKIKKFFYFSTVHVYGMPLIGMLNEESLSFPQHHYAISHKMAEDYVLAFNQKELSTTVFRLSNAIGSPLSAEVDCWVLVVNDLCQQIVFSQEMQVFSPPSTLRDYFPIASICSVLATSIDKNIFSGKVVNLSAGASTPLRELVNLIKERSRQILGISPKIIYHEKINEHGDENLIISNKVLKEGVSSIDIDLSDEIDTLLLNCKQWFKNEEALK